ncbi:calcium-binding protein [Aliamphritea spongicola]|nr:calcium-binding protein [Aliamphritea spongicola]
MNTAISSTDNLETADTLTAAKDTVDGGEGKDIIFGDKGEITQVSGTNRILTTGAVVSIANTNRDNGGDDILRGNAGNDIIIGGFGADRIDGGADNDILLGDSGKLDYTDGDTDISTLDSIVTLDAAVGGTDTLYGNGGNDIVIGGADSDKLYGGNGVGNTALSVADNDILIGDLGKVTLSGNNAVLVTSLNTNTGKRDEIEGNEGGDIILAGAGDDQVQGNAGNDIILGDFGDVDLRNNAQVITTVTGTAHATGDDTIDGGEGYDSILGGLGTDTLKGAGDNDDIIGDNGILTYTGAGILESAETREHDLGARDIIDGGNGDNLILAGFGNDEVTAGTGNDWVIGDNGRVELTNGILTSIDSTDTTNATGGDDTITLTGGNNQVVAGVGTDTVTTGNGNDNVIGDNGTLRYTSTGILESAETSEHDLGARDIIDAGNGDNLILAGFGNDEVTAGTGNDRVIGDNGRIERTNGIVTSIDSTDTTNATGGDDTITLTGGHNQVIAGVGKDTVTTGNGNDNIIGDNGTLSYSASGVLTAAFTTDPSLGDADTIDSGAGNDIVLGGYAGDTLTTGAGDDTVIGDNGQVNLLNGIRSEVFSTDTTNATGGNDTVSLGSGEDQLIAGVGNDTVTNDSGETVVIGDDGRISSDTAGRYLTARTGNTSIGGNDTLTGGSDRDILLGGFGNDRIDGAAGNDLIGGDGSLVERTSESIVFNSVDLFTGGDDVLIGGSGLDRLQGHFGSDFFYASFTEDVFVGEYGRFVFSADAANEEATSITTLAQGGLDLIRGSLEELISNFSKEVFEQSALGEVARSRTAVVTEFSNGAEEALGRLLALVQGSSGSGPGVDIVLPTAPTAAGIPAEGEGAEAEGAEATEEAEACVENEDGFCEAVEEGADAEAVETEAAEQSEAAEQADAAGDTGSATTAENTSGINLEAALAGFSGWAVMKAGKSSSKQPRNKDGWDQE